MPYTVTWTNWLKCKQWYRYLQALQTYFNWVSDRQITNEIHFCSSIDSIELTTVTILDYVQKQIKIFHVIVKPNINSKYIISAEISVLVHGSTFIKKLCIKYFKTLETSFLIFVIRFWFPSLNLWMILKLHGTILFLFICGLDFMFHLNYI